VTEQTPDSLQLNARRTWLLLGSTLAATVAVLALATYRTTIRAVPSCPYVELLGEGLDAEDAPLVARRERDTPRNAGVIDLGPLAVRWDSVYAGHDTSTGQANEMTVDVRHSCDGGWLNGRLLPRSTTPDLSFELYHADDSEVYRVVALDGAGGGASDRYEAGHLAVMLKHRSATRPLRLGFLHIPLLAAFVAAAYGAIAARRPLRDARGARRRPSAPSAGVFRTSAREDEEMAFEERLLLRSMSRDRQRALTPLVLAVVLGLVAVIGTLIPAG
jgi:hypothetical protein